MASDKKIHNPIFRSGPPILNPTRPLNKESLQSEESHSYLWVGHVIHVDVETMVCSISIDMGSAKEWHDVPIPSPGGSGPRSWSGTIPEPSSKVLIEWKKFGNRNYKPYIVEFLTSGVFPARNYEPFSVCDPEWAKEALKLDPELAFEPRCNLGVIRLKNRKVYSGDYLASSSGGSDFILDKNACIQNRAGSEFKLRDSDQTAVLQTINEFTSSSAGMYKRGLIRRNAFNFLPDLFLSAKDREFGMIGEEDVDDFLYNKNKSITNSGGTWDSVLVDKIDKDSPAFSVLKQFGLIKDNGEVNIQDQTDPMYPYVVTSDGRRQSYIVHGTHDLRWDETDECYVEDRAEIYHTHDGIMSVTEDGDGIQVDNPLSRVFIEDVRGTVVGNDPYSEAGKILYKRILSMNMFSDLDDIEEPRANLYAIDTAQNPSSADSIALARLFRIKCPSNSNKEYTFAITKEGRVFLDIPESNKDRQSVDLHTSGGIKAFLGPNSDRVSLNLKTAGGIKCDIGSFLDDASDDKDSVSLDVTLHGKMKISYSGVQGRETTVSGTDYTSVGGSHVVIAGGSSVVSCSGVSALEAEGRRVNVGTGGYALRSLGSYDLTALGESSESYAKLKVITNYLGSTKLVVAGVDSTTVLVGSHTTTVGSGAYAVTVGAGNLSLTSGINSTFSAVANVSIAGGAAVTSFAAGAHTTMAGGINMMIGAAAVIQAPVVKIGMSVTGCVAAGIPGPGSFHIDYITGVPITGIPTSLIGI